jgi:hypothetical protein
MDAEKLSDGQRERLLRKLTRKLERKTREVTNLRKELKRDHERFKNVWAAVQSFAIAGGVVVGGFWTAYQANAIKFLRRSNLSMNVNATQLAFRENGTRFVRVDVVFARTGDDWTPEGTWVDLKNAVVEMKQITKVERDGTSWETTEPWRLKLPPIDRLIVEANQTDTETAIQELPGPGLYRVDVTVPYIDTDKKDQTPFRTHTLFVVK